MAESGTYDDATLARRYAIAQKLMESGQAPVRNWTQGLANMANSALGGFQIGSLDAERQADKAQERADIYKYTGAPAPPVAAEPPSLMSKITALLSGGSTAPASPVAPPAVSPVPSAPSPLTPSLAPAIAAPVPAARSEVMPSAKVWGDKEAEDAGLYEPTPAGKKIVATLSPSTDISAQSRPPAPVGGGLLPGVADDDRSQIAAMLSSKSPVVRALGQAKFAQLTTPKTVQSLGEGYIWKNGKVERAYTPEDKPPTSVSEFKYYTDNFVPTDKNPKPMDYATWLNEKARNAGTNINLNTAESGTKAMQAKAVEDFQEVQKASRDAVKRSQVWDSMEQAARGFTPGATADIKLTAKRYLKDAGIIAGEDVPDAEVFKQMQQQIAIHAQPKGQGAVSNSERELFAKAIPNITQSPEALSRSIKISRSLDEYDRKVAQVYRDNARKNNGIPNSVEVNEEIEKLGSPLSVGDTNYLSKASKGTESASAASSTDAGRAALEAEMRKRGLLK